MSRTTKRDDLSPAHQIAMMWFENIIRTMTEDQLALLAMKTGLLRKVEQERDHYRTVIEIAYRCSNDPHVTKILRDGLNDGGQP